LKSLRSQMNPHFIFNSLNSINGFIASQETREANKYLTDFSRMMRMVLDNSAKDFVPLDEELSAMSLYLKLEHVRFQDRFNYQFNVADSITPHQHRIPPMLVQPYIENAIWHGLRYKESMGQLLVSFEQNETHLVLRITDDGIGRAQSQKLKTANQKQHNSMGMKNTEERITLLNRLYKQPITVQIADLTSGSHPGTEVVIKIPLALTEEMT
ncbi:MAG: histidine kinase, partial [Bacteroidota bacterium]